MVKEKVSDTETVSEQNEEANVKQNPKKKKKQKTVVDKNEKPDKKEINSVKLVYLTLFLVVLGGVILYASGIFEDASVPEVSQQSQQGMNNPHQGADLSKLEQINTLREHVKNNPDDHQAELDLAHLLNDSGFKQEAIQWYESYLKVHPDAADVWVDMGVCYYDLNDFTKAVNSMKKGIELNPQHQIAHFNLGIVNYAMGDVDKAKEWWEKAIQINPSSDIAAKARELIQNN